MNLVFQGVVHLITTHWGVRNLISCLDFTLRAALIPHGLINHGGENLNKFKGKDCGFVGDWLKTKGLYKLKCTNHGKNVWNVFIISVVA